MKYFHRIKNPRSVHTLFHALKESDVADLLKASEEEERSSLVRRVMARKLDGPDGAEMGRNLPREHSLISDKSLADVVEALIGRPRHCAMMICTFTQPQTAL